MHSRIAPSSRRKCGSAVELDVYRLFSAPRSYSGVGSGGHHRGPWFKTVNAGQPVTGNRKGGVSDWIERKAMLSRPCGERLAWHLPGGCFYSSVFSSDSPLDDSRPAANNRLRLT